MSKRKAEEDEDKRPDPDGPWANNKQFHPTPSSYADYRRELLEAAAAAFAPVGGPPLVQSQRRGPMEQCIAYIELRDPKPLLELVQGYRFEEHQLEILLARALHANLLEVVGQLLERAPALLNENLVEYAVRTLGVSLLSVTFILTLLAEKNSTTVEQTAQLALKRLGQDQLILDQTKIAKLRKLAHEGVPAKQPELKLVVEDDKLPVPEFEYQDTRAEVHWICFTPDSKYVATSSYYTDRVNVYDWRAKRLEKALDFSICGGTVSKFVFSPDGQIVYAVAHETGHIMACRMDEEKATRDLVVNGDWSYPTSIAVSHDGELLVVGCTNGQLIVADTAKWTLVKQLELPNYVPVSSVCFSLDDRQLFVIYKYDHHVRAFDVRSWVQRILINDTGTVHSMVCHPTKPLLVGVGEYANTVWYFNYETKESGEAVFSRWTNSQCNLQFSGRGRYLVIASGSGVIVLLDTEEGWKIEYDKDTSFWATHMVAPPVSLGIIATHSRDTVRVFDLRGIAKAQDSLGSVVSAGLSNRGQPQSAWDVFLSNRLRDPRILLFANQFLTGSRHRPRC